MLEGCELIRVLLVQEQRLFSEGVKAIIETEPELEVVGITETSSKLLELIEQVEPDVMLIDIKTGKIDGIQTTTVVKEKYPHIKVVFLSDEIDEELVLRGINVGADGFIMRDMYPDTCKGVIRRVHRGENVLCGKVAKILVQKVRELTKDKKTILSLRLENNDISLTARELDIAHLLMRGKSNKRIAHRLQISEGTVKNYISEIYQKINIRRRKDAIDFLKKLVK
ncbi:response regulator transcription factor [Cerasibacillus terrae]|uniref:Response regulator transcription factor n=1 Tax=Cerasibacillus terrae TaxID=2498845 RepID=A0A5C8P058_9BACI|nr:response regulator transcription factor [Cerasibacillus terrae]